MAAPAALAAAPLLSEGSRLAGDVMAHVSAALGTPLLSVEETHYRRGRTTTTKASVPAWFVVGGLVAGAAALWIVGMGMKPGHVVRIIHHPETVVHHPETGHWEEDYSRHGDISDRRRWIVDKEAWDETVPAWDETISKDMVILTERPRMLLPFTDSSGAGSTPGLPNIPAFIWSLAFPGL